MRKVFEETVSKCAISFGGAKRVGITGCSRYRPPQPNINLASEYFFDQDMDYIIKKLNKVSDWNAKVFSATFCLTEYMRLY